MSSIVYFLQVSACTGIFYLFYQFLLRRLTFFTINRWYLLATILLSFIIPVLRLPVNPQHQYIPVLQQAVYVNTLQNNPIVPTPILKGAISPTYSFNWLLLLKLIYLIAVLVLTCHLIVTMILFFKRLKSSSSMKIKNMVISKSNKGLTNGSFLNYIFLNDQTLSFDEQQQIIAHEMLHVKLYHSIDRIFSKLAQIILWFNPFIYLYAKAIEVNHEFEVDRHMARATNKNNYANLLMHLAITGQGVLYNNFSKAPLKKRINMLFNKPSANMKKATYLLIVPVVLISCLAFSRLKSFDVIKTHISARRQDSIKYRQKIKINEDVLKQQAKLKAYRLTDDFKNKEKALKDISNKDILVTVKDVLKDKQTGKTQGFIVTYGNIEYEIRTTYGQEKQLNDLLKAGDKITLKVYLSAFGEDLPFIRIDPAYVIKNNIKIFQLAEADKLPNYPFLYETNKVRFANGQVSNIKKYPDGKWKTALFETVNGYKFNLSFKQNAPDLNSIEWGDHITLRFVHEVKTGNKAYKINDWVSLSTNSKDYGVKNPDLFYKFYTAI